MASNSEYQDNQLQTFDPTSLERSASEFLREIKERDILGFNECLEKTQPPIRGVVLSFKPFILTDFSFQYSLQLDYFDHLRHSNSDLEFAIFEIELIEWKWRLSFEEPSDDQNNPKAMITAICSSFKIIRDSSNMLDVDMIPPSLLTRGEISSLLDFLAEKNQTFLQKCSVQKHEETKVLQEITNRDDAQFSTKEILTNQSTIEKESPVQKENWGISPVKSKLDLNYQIRKKFVLRGHPVLIKLRERSRSKSPSKSTGVISVLSEDEN